MRLKSSLPDRALRFGAAALLGLSLSCTLQAQSPRLTIDPPQAVSVKRGASAEVKLQASLNEGFHANSHTPADESLIPLKLTWAPGPLAAKDVVYPKPKMEKYAFSDKPLSVVTGKFEITTKFAAPPNASPGPATMTGKVRYQACNENACFPPKTVEVTLPVVIQ